VDAPYSTVRRNESIPFFRIAYTNLFSKTTTYDQVTSIEQAILCYHDVCVFQQPLEEFFYAMTEQGQLDIVKYLYLEDDFTLTASFSAAAARNGHFDLLRCLVRSKCPVDAMTFAGAASHGDLAMLQWLYGLPRPFSEKFPWDGSTCSMAALNGHMRVLQWARSKGCPWDARTCAMAACNHHTKILLWARFKRCPWDSSVCANAAMNGHLDDIRWLRKNGCPWDETTCLIFRTNV
jgi:hypothetical protein